MYSQRRAIVAALRDWAGSGKPAVLATVIASSESAPRGIGAQLAVTEDDVWVGGLSGGCAEIVVLEASRRLLGASDDAALRVEVDRETSGAGPACGARLDVLVERVDRGIVDELDDTISQGARGLGVEMSRSYTSAAGGMRRVSWSIGTPDRVGATMTVTDNGDSLTIVEYIAPPPRLIICGAGDVATDLTVQAQRLGWRTTLLDPRATFVAQTMRHCRPDAVVNEWPDAAWPALHVTENDACVTAAHDDKLDMPFLEKAISSRAFYVGAVGSRRVQAERRAQLAAAGDSALARIHGPAGLNLGGTGAAEIALSIMAEIMATLHSRRPVALSDTTEPVRAQ